MQKIMFNDRYGLTDAVLRGEKTQTRRTEFKHNEQAVLITLAGNGFTPVIEGCEVVVRGRDGYYMFRKPTRYKVGEVVAVAQSYKDCIEDCIKNTGLDVSIKPHLAKEAGYGSKMFVKPDLMPHHIRITGIRVQRLQDISDEDCLREGIFEDMADNAFPPPVFYDFPNNNGNGFDTPRKAYAALIDRVSGKGTWDSNPFVVAYEFELVD